MEASENRSTEQVQQDQTQPTARGEHTLKSVWASDSSRCDMRMQIPQGK